MTQTVVIKQGNTALYYSPTVPVEIPELHSNKLSLTESVTSNIIFFKV